MTSTIEPLWRDLSGGSLRPAHRAVAQGYPIELFAQLDASDRLGLLAISAIEPERPPSYTAFEIIVGHRADGRWAVSLSLSQASLAGQFATLCDKIIELGALQAPSTDAGTFLLNQVARWHRLLAVGSDGLLSAEQQRGLFGELVVLDEAITQLGVDGAVDGWVGPDDAPQDFVFSPFFIEVKTVLSGTPTVAVSSLEQLDIASESLLLCVVEIVQCGKGTGGKSLYALANELRGRIESNVTARQRLEEQLERAGFRDRSEYRDLDYRVSRTRWFKVGATFPRLCRSALPLAITEAKYRLMLAALDEHETDAFGDHGRN